MILQGILQRLSGLGGKRVAVELRLLMVPADTCAVAHGATARLQSTFHLGL